MEGHPSSELWDQLYLDANYADVYSVSQDTVVCEHLCAEIPDDAKRILVPGCGNQIYLQRHISERRPLAEHIYCTDWSQVAIQQSREHFSVRNVEYLLEDSTCLSFLDCSFDAVIICNSVLSTSEVENQKMICEFYRVLREGGVIVGLFPTIFSALDISINVKEKRKWQTDGTILLNEAKFNEECQGIAQVFCTPLQLRTMLKKAKLKISKLSIYCFDSDTMLKEGERVYGIPQFLDCPVWELFVVAVK